MKQIVTFSGIPGVGKTTSCLGLNYYLSLRKLNIFYADEWVKDWANRKVPIDALDQFTVFGNQVGKVISGVKSDCDLVTSCSSPELCAFYAQYYNHDRYVDFSSLIGSCHELRSSLIEKGWMPRNIFLMQQEKQYRDFFQQSGRFQSIDECLEMQNLMLDWLTKNFDIEVRHAPIDVLALANEISSEQEKKENARR